MAPQVLCHDCSLLFIDLVRFFFDDFWNIEKAVLLADFSWPIIEAFEWYALLCITL
jgi:hypothetical protein